MKTVLHLERKFTSNTETFIVNQINTIKKFNVIVGTISETGLLDCDSPVIKPLKVSHLSKSAKYLSAYTANQLYKQISKYRIDLIHTHYLVDAIFFHKLTKRYKAPKICSAYGYDISSFPNIFMGLPKYFYPRIFQEYDFFLAMSQDMKDDLIALGCPESKIVIHYYGTDIHKFLNPSRIYNHCEKAVKILSVGTLEEKKAQHLVVDALYILNKEYGITDFEYHLVGSGDYGRIIRDKVDKYGLSDRVFFHGYIPYKDTRLISFYEQADIFTLPSITLNDNDKEGIPGTIVEAMANGLPVVSTFHAGIPSAIQNEEEGLLVQERDEEGLAKALFRLITQPELRKRLGENAQKKARRELDLNTGTERLEEIYRQAIIGSNIRIKNIMEQL